MAELAKVAPKANVRWAVAGRDASKIKSTLAGLVGMGKTMPFIIEADVFAVESLDNMCSQTKVLIDCVGPFRFFGEQVVKACIKNRTDYVDITGEPEFIENMMYKYSKLAQDSGVSIVPACGFDSIPSEFAVVYAKREMSQQAVTPSAVELFIRAKGSGTSSPQVNYGTYESLIHSIASMNNLRKLRQQFKRPKIPVVGPKLKLNPWPHWESRVKSYVIPFFFADPTIVRISQQLVEEGVWSKKAPKPEPVQFLAYIMLPNLLSALGFLGWLLLISIMSQFQVTRKLALDHPRLFSFGVFSRQGPTEEHLKLAGFKSTVFASGYSKGRAQGSESVPGISPPQLF